MKVTVAETKEKDLEKKKDSPEAKKIRAAQSVGKVKLNETKEFTITTDSKHLSKGQKVKLNKPTEALFRERGYIK